MKTNSLLKITSVFILHFMLLFQACSDVDTFTPYNDETTFQFDRNQAISDFKDLKSTHTVFSFYAGYGHIHNFPDDSQIEFYPNSFTLNGNPIGNKLITIEIDFILNKKEMVENLVGTNSGNQILVSGGMVNVLAHCNGMPLELAPTSEYSLRIATKNQIPDEMEMFYGEETETGINWIESDNDPNTQNNVNQSEWVRDSNSRFTIGMECFPKKLGWVNCDYFTKDNTQEKTNPCLIATTPPNGDSINLTAVCVFKNLNVMLNPCCTTDKDKICFGPLPINEAVYYIIIGKGKQNYYLGYVEKTILKDDVVSINLEVKTLQEIKDFLSTL
ncbi:MAG: hypothetical protein IPO78_00890 [Saprospiraceae bacterium]|nr:hypothetical protein [Saprospiraceae bacterium]MBK9222803.1 hypothetical protein [Saprospiraceae bacterium]MBK9720157.1 hypothetical protein [Saprospiraceae bacterium]